MQLKMATIPKEKKGHQILVGAHKEDLKLIIQKMEARLSAEVNI